MTFDIMTLMAVGSFIAALAALVLGGAWMLTRDQALAWWAAANVALAIGIAVLIYGLDAFNATGIALGGAIAALNPALVWAGVRNFSGRRIPLPILFAGTAIVVVAAAMVPLLGSPQTSARTAGFLVWIGYLLAAIWELWRGRGELLRARWALMAFFAIHAVVFLGGVFDSLYGSLGVVGVPLSLRSWFGAIHFESLFYSMGTAVFMVVLCKERSEHGYRKAAGLDSLTGIANRGAFMANAAKLLARAHKDDKPLTLVLFDLDHFKTINDSHGHQAGDRALRLFADSARKFLRPSDLFGRHGGEEFALVLPAATIETGYVIAERIRTTFAEACRQTGDSIAATVSAGVATAKSDTTLDALVGTADAALYRAKKLGRNRVEKAGHAGDGDDPPKVIRVA
jgi:diguanylate cyclase (GGDEF)-like protein